MSDHLVSVQIPRVFGLADWTAWLDGMARRIFGMSGEEFEQAYRAGSLVGSGPATDLASVLPLIDALRIKRRNGSVS